MRNAFLLPSTCKMLVIIHMWHIESYLPYRHVHLGIWACTCIRQTWAYMGIWHIWAPYIHMAHMVKHIRMWNMYRYITCEKLINCILENVNLGIWRYTCQTYRLDIYLYLMCYSILGSTMPPPWVARGSGKDSSLKSRRLGRIYKWSPPP